MQKYHVRTANVFQMCHENCRHAHFAKLQKVHAEEVFSANAMRMHADNK